MTTHPLPNDIVSVFDLLSDRTLKIPKYQRPYKWQVKHVSQLLNDVALHSAKSSYRLGTIVFHRDKEGKNIVDGQQRTITLILVMLALIEGRFKGIKNQALKDQLSILKRRMINPEFESDISKRNVYDNYQAIFRIVTRHEFTEKLIYFLLHKCKVVTFVLSDVSEAFQFFDSQNARGKDLDPHDLLKAFHLREFVTDEISQRVEVVQAWEDTESSELVDLFSQYLYRIRNWVKGASARDFSKNDVAVFKGVNLSKPKAYPFAQPMKLIDHTVEQRRLQAGQTAHSQKEKYPFQLDQKIINGRRFFEMIEHYKHVVDRVRQSSKTWSLEKGSPLDDFAVQILQVINTYSSRKRTGDKYVRVIFDCVLIFYVDKFGQEKISQAIEQAFIWAYSLRLKMQVLQLATMDNHVLENNLFKIIADAIEPDDFLQRRIHVDKEVKSSNTPELEALFKQMRYL